MEARIKNRKENFVIHEAIQARDKKFQTFFKILKRDLPESQFDQISHSVKQAWANQELIEYTDSCDLIKLFKK